MDAVRKYYTELEPPAADAPDVVKLIHWGAGYYLVNPATKDPSQDPDPRKIHAQTVEQVAYVVWGVADLKQWLPRSFYEKCRNFCEQNWAPSLEIGKWWHPSTYLTVDQVTGNNPMGGLLILQRPPRAGSFDRSQSPDARDRQTRRTRPSGPTIWLPR